MYIYVHTHNYVHYSNEAISSKGKYEMLTTILMDDSYFLVVII